MIFLLIILLLLQLLTYLIIRGGTMNKSPQEIKDEQVNQRKMLIKNHKVNMQKFSKLIEFNEIMKKRTEESEDELDAESKWLKEQKEKKKRHGGRL